MTLMLGSAEDEEAFDVLYCIAFEMMDAQWLAMHASYMNFNVIPLPVFSAYLPHKIVRTLILRAVFTFYNL